MCIRKVANQLMIPFGFICLLLSIIALVKLSLFLHLSNDFSTFYLSLRAYSHMEPAYIKFSRELINIPGLSGINLNPPFFLFLLSPLAKLSFAKALYVWQISSYIALIIATHLSLKHAKLNSPLYYLAVFLSYPVLMNFLLAQVGAFIFLLIILGYDCYKKNRIVVAGGVWGLATGLKFFPGLLLFYALSKKQYKLCLVFCLTVLLTLLIPYLISGIKIYSDYFHALSAIKLYRHAWSGSFLGFIHRTVHSHIVIFGDMSFINNLGGFLVGMLALTYAYLMLSTKEHIKQQRFNLTIVYMLILSPVAWVYYFPILFIPLSSLINRVKYIPLPKKLGVLFVFVLILYPKGSYNTFALGPLLNRITLYSQYFYALLFTLGMLLWTKPNKSKQEIIQSKYFNIIGYLVMAFLYGATFNEFFVKLIKAYFAQLSKL